jgi:hypothetical protein
MRPGATATYAYRSIFLKWQLLRERLPGLERQRHEGAAPARLHLPLAIRFPLTGKGGNPAMRIIVTEAYQIGMQLLDCALLLAWLVCFRLQPGRQSLGVRNALFDLVKHADGLSKRRAQPAFTEITLFQNQACSDSEYDAPERRADTVMREHPVYQLLAQINRQIVRIKMLRYIHMTLEGRE